MVFFPGTVCCVCRVSEQGQIFAGHDGMAGIGVAKIVESQPIEIRVFAHRARVRRELELPLVLGVSREQEGVSAPLTGERIKDGTGTFPKGDGARRGLAVGKADRFLSGVAPSETEPFTERAGGERQQADRVAGIGPFRFAGVEGTAQSFELVGVEEPGDFAARVPADAETGVGITLSYPIPRP